MLCPSYVLLPHLGRYLAGFLTVNLCSRAGIDENASVVAIIRFPQRIFGDARVHYGLVGIHTRFLQ